MKDYMDIGTVTPMKVFSAKLAEVSQRYVKAHKPFDEQCARLDFKDKLDSAEKESERRHGFVKVDEIKIDSGDLEKYGNLDRFEFITEEITYGDKLNHDGRKVQGPIGKTQDYKCKVRGHGISVFIPNLMDEEVEVKKKKEK